MEEDKNTLDKGNFFKRYSYDIEKDKLSEDLAKVSYKAFDNYRDQYVEINMLDYITIGDSVISFIDNCVYVSKAQYHKNIAKLYSFYTFDMKDVDKKDFVVMQYYPEGSLGHQMSCGNLTFESKENIAIGLLDGISHLHKNDILHTGLKPKNILIQKLNEEYVPKITGFEFIAQKKGENSSFFNTLGSFSLYYSAPEQFEKDSVLYFSTDLWAWAVIIYELFTGNKLLKGELDRCNVDKQSLELELLEFPDNWKKALLGCLEQHPQDRIKTAEEVKQIIGLQSNSEVKENEQ